jgi:transglutaminase-like putative cysteine protease
MQKKIVMKNLPGYSGSINDTQPVSYNYPQIRFDLFESSGNLPRAFRPLLLTTRENYDKKSEWSMINDRSEFIGYVHFRLKTWSQFNEKLLEHDKFGMYLHQNAGTNQGLIAENAEELARVNAVYQFVKSNFTWNGEYAHLASQDFRDFMKTRTGNSAELNLILVNLLRQNGIKSDPVLIRTVDQGLPERMYPVKNQFNHVIATAHIGGSVFLFDATSNSQEPNKLNKLDIGTQGWVVSKDNPGWVETYSENTKKAVDKDIPIFNL